MFSVLFSLAPLSVKSARFEHLYVVQYYWYILDTVWVYRICTCAPASVCYMCACMFTLSDIIPLYVSLCVYIHVFICKAACFVYELFWRRSVWAYMFKIRESEPAGLRCSSIFKALCFPGSGVRAWCTVYHLALSAKHYALNSKTPLQQISTP